MTKIYSSHQIAGSSVVLSLLQGSQQPALIQSTLSQLLDDQCRNHQNKTAVVASSSRKHLSYGQLRERSRQVAKGLLYRGVKNGDTIGVLAGNCIEYVELLFACGRIGAILAVLNNSYTPTELQDALLHSGCKLLFTTTKIGSKLNNAVVEILRHPDLDSMPDIEGVVLLGSRDELGHNSFQEYSRTIEDGTAVDERTLRAAESKVDYNDVCNLQYTSGTTGNPKAAMLTHFNIINNARFIGDRMDLKTSDILCCPPPLFHCFGLVLGLLAVVTRAGTIVFPSESFDAKAVIQALREEACTALHGVPAMWTAEMQLLQPGEKFPHLRTGIAAGSATPRQMMEDLQEKLNLTELTNTYGMTETSPASFMTSWDDPLEKRLSTVGKILPHVTAKIIDTAGNIIPLGSKGELCIAGYLLQKGYLNNPEKTSEVMMRDEQGMLWMHTGDEAFFDQDGYCKITGRIKDMIIRGGENIFPLEIEERLVQHPNIATAAVVGLRDAKYGELVAAFLQAETTGTRTSDDEIKNWVQQKLARHKTPQHVYWMGDPGIGESLPLTGSGKVKKNVLRHIGNAMLAANNQETGTETIRARL